jgi:Domain of unknown function (DUF4384)
MRVIWLGVLAMGAIGFSGFAQEDAKKLTARELFYSAADSPAPAPKTAKPAAKSKPAARKSTPAVENATASANPSSPVVAVAYKPTGPHPALGLRYTILKRAGDGQSEVNSDTEFHAGDRIRLAVEANDDGYLYVVNRGSSGTWKLLFPSAEIKGGDNRIQRRVRYEVPSGYTFTFDEQGGEEKLFLVLTRQPEPDLEGLIYSLGQKTGTPASAEKPKTLLASAAFTDDVIGKLRNSYARDLIVERVDDEAAGPKQEKAVYAVNPTGSADSRVVADVTLKHQ